jgi:hypothetical protein
LKKFFLIVIITTLLKQLMFGQGGFNKNYLLSASYVSVCTDVIEAPNGNIIMTGLTYDATTASNRLTILGADAQGNQLWRKNYGSDKFEYLDNFLTSRSIMKDNDCFYFYTAVLDSNNEYLSAFIKFNFNGDTIWQKKYYDSVEYLILTDVVKSVDNGFLMTGQFGDPINPIGKTLLIKTDSMGKELWRKKISKVIPNIQAGNGVVQDSSTKKIIICGYQANGTSMAYDYCANVIVTDSLGIELQRRTFSSTCGGIFSDLIQTKDKKCVVVGINNQCNNNSGGTSRYKSYVVKFDLNNLFNVSWTKEFDILSIYNSFATVNELKNSDLILAGNIDTLYNYGYNEKGMLRLIKLDKDGNLKWKKLYSRDSIKANSKRVRSLNVTANGSYLIANELYWATNPRPYSITKIDSTGCDSTIAYCSAVGLNELNSKNEGLKIYPNPTDGMLNVEIEELKIEDYKLKIYDAIGQLIREEEITFKENKTTINTKELANGVYVLRLSSLGTRNLNTNPSYRQDDNQLIVSKRFVIAR